MMARLLLAAALVGAAEALLAALAGSQPQPSEGRGQQRVAILISGMCDRLLVTPLVENLVRANVEAGTQIDTYFSMKPPSENQNYAANKGESKWLVTESSARQYVVDARIAQARSVLPSNDDLFAQICRWSQEAGATMCTAEPEAEEPLELPDDAVHRGIMSYYNPLSTESGRSVLKRWRTSEKLWGKAKEVEHAKDFRYNSVVLVRDDDYWLSPYIFETSHFEAYPNSLKSISCLEAHGINDKMLHIGREAADHMVMAYQAWKEVPNEALRSTRNAEEFLYKLATLRGVDLQTRGFSYALGAATTSGIPCFRKQSFNLTDRGGYHKCHSEVSENSPITKLFKTFSCDTMNPAYYEALGKMDIFALKNAVAKAAGDVRHVVVFTVVDSASIESAVQTLLSLRGPARAVVVTHEQGVCDRIEAQSNIATCIALSVGVLDLKVKLALLSTALSSGAARGILFAEPGVQFQNDPIQLFSAAGTGQDVVFAPKQSEQCKEMINGADVTSSLFYVKDTPGGLHALLRAWMFLVEGPLPGGFYAGERVVSGINWELSGKALKVGDVGTVRVVSHKDPQRVVVDFDSWTGMAVLPKQILLKGPSALLARAVAASTGVRESATVCGRLGWERLPRSA